MAAGDVHVIAKWVANNANNTGGKFTNAIKMGIITNSTTPSVTDSDPRWGAGGTSELLDERGHAGRELLCRRDCAH